MPDAFRLKDWLIEPNLNRLTREGASRAIEPKLMAVLCKLADHAGEVIDQPTLLAHVWPDTHVTDTILRRAISELRRILGDDAKNPRYLETVPKKGYRLIAEVVPIPSFEIAQAPAAQLPYSPIYQAMTEPPHAVRRNLLLYVVPLLCLSVGLWWFNRPRGAATPRASEAGTAVLHFDGTTLHTAPDPAGRRVLLVGDDGRGTQVYRNTLTQTVDPPPTAERRTEDGFAKTAAAFAPDGRTMAVAAKDADGDALYTLSEDGTYQKRWTAPGPIEDLLWAEPERLWLCLRAEPGRALQLHPLELPADGPPRLQPAVGRPPAHFWGDHTPRRNSDGTLAFIRAVTPRVADLFVWEGTGTHPRRLTFLNARLAGADWLPDGDALVVSVYARGRYRLWRVAADSGERTRMDIGEDARDPRVAGGQLFYRHENVNTAIWRATFQQHRLNDPTVYIFSATWDTVPRVDPFGRNVAFMSTRAGTVEVFLLDITTFNLQRLTASGGPFTANPAWSPDGRTIAYEMHTPQGADLYLQPVAGGPPQQLTFDAGDETEPCFSKDGAWIYFSSTREEGRQIWRTTPSGATPRRITGDGGYRVQTGAGDTWLYYTRFEQPEIRRMHPDGSAAETVLADPAMQWENWAVAGQDLYYVAQKPGEPAVLHRHDIARGKTEAVRILDTLPEPGSLTASPDGLFLLWALEDSRNSVLKRLKLD